MAWMGRRGPGKRLCASVTPSHAGLRGRAIGDHYRAAKVARRASLTDDDLRRVEQWRRMTSDERREWKARTRMWAAAANQGTSLSAIASLEGVSAGDVAFELEALARGNRKRWTWS